MTARFGTAGKLIRIRQFRLLIQESRFEARLRITGRCESGMKTIIRQIGAQSHSGPWVFWTNESGLQNGSPTQRLSRQANQRRNRSAACSAVIGAGWLQALTQRNGSKSICKKPD